MSSELSLSGIRFPSLDDEDDPAEPEEVFLRLVEELGAERESLGLGDLLLFSVESLVASGRLEPARLSINYFFFIMYTNVSKKCIQ